MHRQGKKLRWHTKLGDIAVLEPRYRLESKSVRPFLRSAKVIPRGCSRALQRAIADFAADQPFAQVQGAIQSDAQYAVDSTNRWRLSRWRRRNSATRSFWHFSRSTLIFEIDSRR